MAHTVWLYIVHTQSWLRVPAMLQCTRTYMWINKPWLHFWPSRTQQVSYERWIWFTLALKPSADATSSPSWAWIKLFATKNVLAIPVIWNIYPNLSCLQTIKDPVDFSYCVVVNIPAPSGHSFTFNHRLMAPPAALQV